MSARDIKRKKEMCVQTMYWKGGIGSEEGDESSKWAQMSLQRFQ